MHRLPVSLLLACLALATPLAVAAPPSSAPLPQDSVYRIPPLQLRDQQGTSFAFASLRGTPRLVGMFYGSCRMACPLEIETLKRIEHAVSAAGGTPLPVLLVSFDPAHDDVAQLRKVAAEHHLQAPLFRLARPEQGDEGMLAGVLGIAYRPLPGGGYSHNVVVALLDAEGRVLATTDASGAPDPAIVRAILAVHAARRAAVRPGAGLQSAASGRPARPKEVPFRDDRRKSSGEVPEG
ncbi:MAG: SCO family protein [Xanthomonadaceae bacterium]|nr:SCO family protein [Xanthomonadaceae bacterium]MDE1957584.1 SCO family protein [Xanthomonadaceae bacterium]MDE2178184.1 SCO family protein [Xanthomonadaceae bacterium]